MATATESPSRGLVAYDQIRDPMAFIREMGDSIAKSGMFGCENIEQGRVLAMTCLAKRLDPLSLVETYHLIQGDLSMRSDAMLAGLHRLGGRHKIIQRDPDAAEIEISIDGETQRFRLTWAEAEQEEFTKDRNGKVKKNYATPRSRMQMLWARVVSDGVRAMVPEVVCGAYTPEEIQDYRPAIGDSRPAKEEAAPAAAVEDAQFEVKSQAPEATQANDGFATAEQVERITDLYVLLKVPHEAQQAALMKRGVRALRSLTREAAAEMIAKLEAKLAAICEQSKADPQATSTAIDTDPCSQVQVDQVKQLIETISQTGDPDIAGKVKTKLQKSGLEKIRDLTVTECDRLIKALSIRNLEVWIDSQLRGHGKAEGDSGN